MLPPPDMTDGGQDGIQLAPHFMVQVNLKDRGSANVIRHWVEVKLPVFDGRARLIPMNLAQCAPLAPTGVAEFSPL